MFIHYKQCAVKAHLPNGRYVIEVTVSKPEKKIKALSTRNFHFARFYTLHKMERTDDIGRLKTQWFIRPTAR